MNSMSTSNNEVRRRIFRQELYILKEKGYLNDAIVEVVSKAHNQYHLDVMHEQQKVQEKQLTDFQSSIGLTPSPRSDLSVPKKPTKTAEEIRERNITWLLNLGVLMLIIGGLFVATSNWETMTSFMKSGSIAAISLVFYGFAYLSRKILKIEKTAFAFTVLGSLFLPIFVLSLGWFGLLGSYLSIDGGGSHYLGVLGSFLPLIVYVYFAEILRSRLFVWFSYISITVGTAFLLAAIQLALDYFYLGMVVYNVLLVICFLKFKNKTKYALFTQELLIFVQINLVLSTLTMLFLFESQAANGFNLLLTAAIYLSMIFVTGKKEYHFVFTAMLVYGAYQFIEHSYLKLIGPVLFALIGGGLLFIPRWFKHLASLEKVFQMTSAIVSVLAFLYISLEGLMLRMGEASFILVLAYFIIGSHFVYMCYLIVSPLFQYLSPVFYAAAIFEFISLFKNLFVSFSLSVMFFISGFLLFSLFGIFLTYKRLTVIRRSSRDIGALMAIGGISLSLLSENWQELGYMLILFSLIIYLIIKIDDRPLFKEFSYWILPLALCLSFVAFGEELKMQNEYFAANLGWVAGFVVGSLVLFLFSVICKAMKETVLEKNSVIIAGFSYTLGLVFSLIGDGDALWVQPFVLLGGIMIYLAIYIRFKNQGIPFIVAITTWLFYFSTVNSIELQRGIPNGLDIYIPTGGAVLLLIVAFFLRRGNKRMLHGFAWTGHLFYSISLLYTYLVFENVVICLLIAVIIYSYSLYAAKMHWLKYSFLYTIFTVIAGIISELLSGYVSVLYDFQWTMVLTSAVIALIWYLIHPFYKEKTLYYWIPFSILGVIICVISDSFPFTLYLVTVGYITAVLIFSRVLSWSLVAIVPLLLLFFATTRYIKVSGWNVYLDFMLALGIGFILLIIGYILFKPTSQKQEPKIVSDVYSPISILFFLYLYLLDIEIIWLYAAPGLFIAFALFLQRNRYSEKWEKIFTTAAGIYLLEPYYSIMFQLEVPALWEREVLLVPWLLLTTFIRTYWKGRYPSQTSLIQWISLVVIALFLIEDGMVSSTIYDALIIGTLSLLSILTGAILRIKSYFLVGAGVLLLNIFLQTKPFWGNMPWWAYLLIAGSILIFVASYHEWQKQKMAKGEITFFTRLKSQLISKWREWS
jgi:hypothetical protein